MAPSDDYVVYRNDLVSATHVVNEGEPSYLGHIALQTKRHARGYAELTDEEAEAVGLATTRISRALKSSTRAENVYAVFFAEVIPHLHVLLTVRYQGTPREYWRMGVFDWPDAPQGGSTEVSSFASG